MKKKLGGMLVAVGAILFFGAVGTSDLETGGGFTGVPHPLSLLLVLASLGLVMGIYGAFLLVKE